MGYLNDLNAKIHARLDEHPDHDELVAWIKDLVYQSYLNGKKQGASSKKSVGAKRAPRQS